VSDKKGMCPGVRESATLAAALEPFTWITFLGQVGAGSVSMVWIALIAKVRPGAVGGEVQPGFSPVVAVLYGR